MEIRDELYVTREHYQPAGAPMEFPSINDHDINELIEKLEAKGVDIDVSTSEKDISYKIRHEERRSRVPLRAGFDENDTVSVDSYVLRGPKLEMRLQDYGKRIGGSAGGGKFGGDVHYRGGVYCGIALTAGGNLDDQLDTLNQLDVVKQTVFGFYEPHSPLHTLPFLQYTLYRERGPDDGGVSSRGIS